MSKLTFAMLSQHLRPDRPPLTPDRLSACAVGPVLLALLCACRGAGNPQPRFPQFLLVGLAQAFDFFAENSFAHLIQRRNFSSNLLNSSSFQGSKLLIQSLILGSYR